MTNENVRVSRDGYDLMFPELKSLAERLGSLSAREIISRVSDLRLRADVKILPIPGFGHRMFHQCLAALEYAASKGIVDFNVAFARYNDEMGNRETGINKNCMKFRFNLWYYQKYVATRPRNEFSELYTEGAEERARILGKSLDSMEEVHLL